uniref:PQ-loop repeat-containing protein n=1 Tax=viral metagenome TaxID=1070528 RepID=A0A6C0HQX2_9ZZZZ
MIYTIFDDSVSPAMNVFLVIGNIVSLVYNIPQMVKTYKTNSTKDFSSTFLFLRVVNNSIWLAYSIELGTFLFLLANITSVICSLFLSYYKAFELYDIYKENKNTIIELKDTFNTDDCSNTAIVIAREDIKQCIDEVDKSDTINDISSPLIN